MKKRHRMNFALTTLLLTLGAAGWLYADGGNNNEIRLRTRLAGAVTQGRTPEGNADFRSDNRGRMRLNVEVENLNLPAGTTLQVSIQHGATLTAAGTISLANSGFGELELNSQDGATVPAVTSGDMVVVANGGVTILAGVF